MMMKMLKRRPLVSALLVVALAVCTGAFVGGVYARYETQAIAAAVRSKNPGDPLDGLFFIFIGYVFVGMLYGAASGFILGLGIYIWSKRQMNLP